VDGVALCRWLKADTATAAIAVIMLSAAQPPRLRERLWDVLLRKPTPMARLIEVISDLLETHRSIRSRASRRCAPTRGLHRTSSFLSTWGPSVLPGMPLTCVLSVVIGAMLLFSRRVGAVRGKQWNATKISWRTERRPPGAGRERNARWSAALQGCGRQSRPLTSNAAGSPPRPVGSRRKHVPAAVIVPEEEQRAHSA
jgi:hypothetical protein